MNGLIAILASWAVTLTAIAREREAYAAQNEFLVRYYHPVGISMHHVGCELTSQ